VRQCGGLPTAFASLKITAESSGKKAARMTELDWHEHLAYQDRMLTDIHRANADYKPPDISAVWPAAVAALAAAVVLFAAGISVSKLF
jgi:hypothetical protein